MQLDGTMSKSSWWNHFVVAELEARERFWIDLSGQKQKIKQVLLMLTDVFAGVDK